MSNEKELQCATVHHTTLPCTVKRRRRKTRLKNKAQTWHGNEHLEGQGRGESKN